MLKKVENWKFSEKRSRDKNEWWCVCVEGGNIWFPTIGLISNYRFKEETGMQPEFKEMSGLEM